LIERAGDLVLGSDAPGPISHAIETAGDLHLPLLLTSLQRHPTPASVLLLNRWANSLIPPMMYRLS